MVYWNYVIIINTFLRTAHSQKRVQFLIRKFNMYKLNGNMEFTAMVYVLMLMWLGGGQNYTFDPLGLYLRGQLPPLSPLIRRHCLHNKQISDYR